MSVNASSLLTLNPTIVNLELGLYGLLFVCIFIYVHMKFRKADSLLKALKKEWDGAESKHAGLIQFAQHRITRLGAGAGCREAISGNSFNFSGCASRYPKPGCSHGEARNPGF